MRRNVLALLPLVVACTSVEAPVPESPPVPIAAGAQISEVAQSPAEPLPSLSVPSPTPIVAVEVPAPTPVATPEPVAPGPPADPAAIRDLAYPTPIPEGAVTNVEPRWTEAARFDDDVTLVALEGGLLSRVGGVAHELVDGVWQARPEVDAARPRALRRAGEVEGSWGDNAWRISAREHNGERESFTVLQFMRWRGNHKWVSQKIPEPLGYGGENTFDDMGTALVRTSGRGGLLLADMTWQPSVGLSIVRIAGGAASPGFEPFAQDMEAVDLYETPGGRVFVFGETYGDDRFIVQRSCRDDDSAECVRKHAVRLPQTQGRRWVPTLMAATSRNGAAFVMRDGVSEDDATHYLLRHEGGRFRFEAIPADGKVKQLLSGEGGGLWAVAETDDADEVLFRGAGGDWHTLARPEGVKAPEVTLARGDDAMWISGAQDTKELYRADLDPTASAPVAGVELGVGSIRTGAP